MSLQQIESLYETWKHVSWRDRKLSKMDIMGAIFIAMQNRKPGDTDERLMRRAKCAVYKMLATRDERLPPDYDQHGEEYRKNLRRAQNEFSAAQSIKADSSVSKRCNHLGASDRLKLYAVLREAMGRGLSLQKAYRYLNDQLSSLGV